MEPERIPTSLELYQHPSRRKKGGPAEVTIGSFLEQYVAFHVSRLVHKRFVEQMMRRYFAPFLHRPMAGLTREELVRWHAAIGAQYPIAANKALVQLKSLYNKALEWGIYKGENPCRYVKQFPAVARSRFVQPGDEMRRLRDALEKDDPKYQAFFYLLLLTGARRSEASRMKWQDINLETGLWTKWTTKTHRSQTIRVPELALSRLRALPHVSEYVFTSRTGKPWAVNLVEWAWQRIRARAGLDDVTIHDLRRTCASWMAIHGTNLAVIQQVLNHSSLAHTGIYARLNQAPVSAALEENAQRMCQQEEVTHEHA